MLCTLGGVDDGDRDDIVRLICKRRGEHANAEALVDEACHEVGVGDFDGDIAAQPGGGECLVGLGPALGAGGEVDEYVLCQLGKSELDGGGERVGGR